ncbi:MAG: thioredoxin family protein [Myxococcales bacterium]|nr:thioredoxin family protein [Myxococcales bacterium]
MVMTPSQMLALGTEAPAFRLPDPFGREVSLDDYPDAKGYLVVFMCNHCPFVRHIRDELANLGRELPARGVTMVGINSNDAETYPDDSPARMRAEAETYGYAFPYLVDASQEVAKAYQAACTPDFFLFDGARSLVYRGQLDDSRPSNGVPVTGADLRAAVDALLTGNGPVDKQVPSIGCNIKWKPGNAPEWFG